MLNDTDLAWLKEVEARHMAAIHGPYRYIWQNDHLVCLGFDSGDVKRWDIIGAIKDEKTGEFLAETYTNIPRLIAMVRAGEVHAYWIQHNAGPLKSECSHCRTTFNTRMEYDGMTTKFCPCCSAKMDGQRAGEGKHGTD